MFVDIAWSKSREQRRKALRKAFLVNRMVRRQANIEHEVETSGGCDDAYITNGNTSTSIYVWEGTAGLREEHWRPSAFHCQVSVVDVTTSLNRKGGKAPHLK